MFTTAMNPPVAKKQRLESHSYNNDNTYYYEEGDDDEQLHPEVRERLAVRDRFKSALEGIFEKYGKDFTGIGDEIDLVTGEVVVDNGHLQRIENEHDQGDDTEDAQEEVFSVNDDLDDGDTGYSSLQDGSKTSSNMHLRETELDHGELDSLNIQSSFAHRLQTSHSESTAFKRRVQDPKWQIPEVSGLEFVRAPNTARAGWASESDIEPSVALTNLHRDRNATASNPKSPGGSLWAAPRTLQYSTNFNNLFEPPDTETEDDASARTGSVIVVNSGANIAAPTFRHNQKESLDSKSFRLQIPRDVDTVSLPASNAIQFMRPIAKDLRSNTEADSEAEITTVRQGAITHEPIDYQPKWGFIQYDLTKQPEEDNLNGLQSQVMPKSPSFSGHKRPARKLDRITSIPNTTQNTDSSLLDRSGLLLGSSNHQEDSNVNATHQAFGKDTVASLKLDTTRDSTGGEAHELLSLHKNSQLRTLASAAKKVLSEDRRSCVDTSLLARSIKEASNAFQSMGQSFKESQRIFQTAPAVVKSATKGKNVFRDSISGISKASVNKPFIPVRPQKVMTDRSTITFDSGIVTTRKSNDDQVHRSSVAIAFYSNGLDSRSYPNLSSKVVLANLEAAVPWSRRDDEPLQSDMIDLTLDDENSLNKRETTPIDTYSYVLMQPWPSHPCPGDRIPGADSLDCKGNTQMEKLPKDNRIVSELGFDSHGEDEDVIAETQYASLETYKGSPARNRVKSIKAKSVVSADKSLHAAGVTKSRIARRSPESSSSDTQEKEIIEKDAKTTSIEAPNDSTLEKQYGAVKPRQLTQTCPLPSSPGRPLVDGSGESPRVISPNYKESDIFAEFGPGRPLTRANLLSQDEIPSTSQETVLTFLNSQITPQPVRTRSGAVATESLQKQHRRSMSSPATCGVNGISCGRRLCFNCTSRAATQEDVEF